MLKVTDPAADALRQARESQELPDSYGVRLFAEPGEDGKSALALAFAEEPVEGDEVTEQGGTEIYIAPEVAEPLAEQKLDVADTPDGPQLALVPQDEAV